MRGSDVQEGCTEGGTRGPVGAPYKWRLRDEKRVPGAAKVRFLAVAEKTAMRALLCKQKIPRARTQLTDYKDGVFFVH